MESSRLLHTDSLLLSLREIPQDPRWHAEGDVWTHTKMVYEALLSLEGYSSLHEEQQLVARFAALFHDCGKRDTTREGTDGITSRGHARRGAMLARRHIYENALLPFALREQVVHLVALHTLPIWILEREDAQRRARTAAEVCSMKTLALIARADAMGRIAERESDFLERITLFEEFSREAGCAEGPFPFSSPLVRFTYLSGSEENPFSVRHDATTCKVYLLSGLPGAGKDTWIATHGPALPVISLDDMRAELGVSPREDQGRLVQEAKERARVFLRKGQGFIWNGTNLSTSIRRGLVSLFTSYGAEVTIVYVESPYQRLLTQNASRADAVPQNILLSMLKKLEVPTPTESHHRLLVLSE